MKCYELKAYIVPVENAGRRWQQLVPFYQDVASPPTPDEVRSALGQMKFGIEPGIADQVNCVGVAEEITGSTLTYLRGVLGMACLKMTEAWIQAAFEYLVFGRGEVPEEMPGIPSWVPCDFAYQAAEIYTAKDHAIKAIWAELGEDIKRPDEQVVA